MRYHPNHKDESGFFKLIAVIIIAAAVLTFLGYNPKILWDSYAVPAILWVWEIVYTIISFIIELIMGIVRAVQETQA